jgi:hypothetical protein
MERAAADVRTAMARIVDDEALAAEGARLTDCGDGWLQLRVPRQGDAGDIAVKKLPNPVRRRWASDPKGWRRQATAEAPDDLERLLVAASDTDAFALAEKLAEWRTGTSPAVAP